MSAKRTARYFWIEDVIGLHFKSVTSIEPKQPHAYVHFREVLPGEISDTERLDWMIENKGGVGEHKGLWRAYWDYADTHHIYNTPREAIDAAIREGKKP